MSSTSGDHRRRRSPHRFHNISTQSVLALDSHRGCGLSLQMAMISLDGRRDADRHVGHRRSLACSRFARTWGATRLERSVYSTDCGAPSEGANWIR